MVLASDGIVESTNLENEPFGFDRLAALLGGFGPNASSTAISAAILAPSGTFSGRPAEPHDDRTLLVLRLAQKTAAM